MAVIGVCISEACSATFPTSIGDHCYAVVSTSKTMTPARQHCSDLGGDLGRIYDFTQEGISQFAAVSTGKSIYPLVTLSVEWVGILIKIVPAARLRWPGGALWRLRSAFIIAPIAKVITIQNILRLLFFRFGSDKFSNCVLHDNVEIVSKLLVKWTFFLGQACYFIWYSYNETTIYFLLGIIYFSALIV